MSNKISIAGLDKAEVLAALFNAAIPPLFPRVESITAAQALLIIDLGGLVFGCVGSRALWIDLSGDDLDSATYDRYNGEGAAARAIERLRTAGAAGKGGGE